MHYLVKVVAINPHGPGDTLASAAKIPQHEDPEGVLHVGIHSQGLGFPHCICVPGIYIQFDFSKRESSCHTRSFSLAYRLWLIHDSVRQRIYFGAAETIHPGRSLVTELGACGETATELVVGLAVRNPRLSG